MLLIKILLAGFYAVAWQSCWVEGDRSSLDSRTVLEQADNLLAKACSTEGLAPNIEAAKKLLEGSIPDERVREVLESFVYIGEISPIWKLKIRCDATSIKKTASLVDSMERQFGLGFFDKLPQSSRLARFIVQGEERFLKRCAVVVSRELNHELVKSDEILKATAVTELFRQFHGGESLIDLLMEESKAKVSTKLNSRDHWLTLLDQVTRYYPDRRQLKYREVSRAELNRGLYQFLFDSCRQLSEDKTIVELFEREIQLIRMCRFYHGGSLVQTKLLKPIAELLVSHKLCAAAQEPKIAQLVDGLWTRRPLNY